MKKYLINTEDYSALEEDVNIFLKECEAIDSIGYILPHYLNTHNEITSYGSLIIEKKGDIDLDYLKEVYNIIPNKIYSNGETKHIVFDLYKGVSKLDYERAGKILTFILGGKTIDHYFFPEYKIIKEFESDKIDRNLIQFLTQLFLQLNNKTNIERVLSKHNYEQYLEANEISLEEILTKLKLPLVDFDSKKNIHLKYGFPFNFVENHLAGQEKAFIFFNENFDLDFELENKKDNSKYTKDGVLIEEGPKFFRGDKTAGYYTINPLNGNMKVITDFYIKVYYKVKRTDGTFVYIVSLINDGYETEKIYWFNGTSKTQFSDYIQKQGNFHFYGGDNDIKILHKEISNVKHIPFVKNIIGYGFHENEGIIVFKNGIWDLKQKVFTEKKDKYYFNYNYQGYFITDKQHNDLSEIIKEGIPSLDTSKVVNLDEVFKFVNSLYKDDTGLFLIFIAFGMFGYLLYGDQRQPFPFLFSKGITASGKTSFNDLLQRIWGIGKGGSDFGNSSVFTMTIMLSHLIKFPYFLGEYRRNIVHSTAKESILRSVFDRKAQQKGRADQTMISYDYVANPIMDGEEVMSDGAVKSRTIQRQFIKAHRIEGNFNQLIKEGGEILDNLMYTYFLKSDRKRYEEGLKEGVEYFHELTKKTNSRIGDNFAQIYAGCYAMDKNFDKQYLEVLTKSCEYQNKDFIEDGTSMQIIKAIGKFLDSNPFNAVYVVRDKVVIIWNVLDEYIKRYRVQLSLDVDTYKEHIISLGYKIDYIDNGERLLYGVIVPFNNIPKQFLIHRDFYDAHKKYLNTNK